MIISMIAAVSENSVIGKDNDLVWRLPDDMQYFMETTKHHHVIMGRKNYESIPHKYRPLPNRTNIIVTRQTDYEATDCVITSSLEKAYDYAKNNHEDEVFVIGGGQIYSQSIENADKLYITEVKSSFDGDAFFPDIDKEVWQEISRVEHTIDERHKYKFDFVVYERVENK